MWSKNACRFSSALRLSGITSLRRASKCGCAQSSILHKTDRSSKYSTTQFSSSSHDHSKDGTSNNLATAAAIAGAGLALSGYVLWRDKYKVYAAEDDNTDVKADDSDPGDLDTVLGPDGGKSTDTPQKENKNNSSATKDAEPTPIDWSTVPDIPEHVPYLLIGGGVASLEAYKAIKVNNPKAKVLMISEEDYPPYWRPPLSKHFWYDDDLESYKQFEYTNLRGKKSSVFLSAGLYLEPKKLPYTDHGGLAYLQNTKVVKLDAVSKKVTLDNGTQVGFDKCLIATGGTPRNLTVLERAGDDVKERTTLFRNLKDMWRLMETTKKAKTIAVIGGGFLGSELAVGLAYRGDKTGLKVHQIFPEMGNMAKVLPVYLSQWTTEQVRKDGVDVITGSNVKSAIFDDGKVVLRLTTGQLIKVDHVVVAVGLEPNTELAESADLELDEKYGGFRVNTELQARSDIWVAGDCACFYDAKLGRRRVEHFDHAEITGRLAGFNMTGDNKPYTYQSMFWSTLGASVDYEAVGVVDSSLDTYSAFRRSNGEDSKKAAIKSDKKDKKNKNDKSKTTESTFTAENYDKGVVFYLKNDEIVGVVLWNLSSFRGSPSRLEIARQIIADGAKGKDLTEVVKLFNIYAD